MILKEKHIKIIQNGLCKAFYSNQRIKFKSMNMEKRKYCLIFSFRFLIPIYGEDGLVIGFPFEKCLGLKFPYRFNNYQDFRKFYCKIKKSIKEKICLEILPF